VQILQHLDGNSVNEVFSVLASDAGSMAAAAETAMHLPQDLLAKWIQSIGPIVDLRDAKLSHIQSARMAMGFSQQLFNSINTLHFSLISHPQPVVHSEEMQRLRHLLQFWSSQRSTSSHCCSCGKESTGMCSKVSVGFQCHNTTCRQFCATTYAPLYDLTSILAMHERSTRSCSEFIHHLKEFCNSAPETPAYCSGCKAQFWGKPSLLLVGFLCSSCGKMCSFRIARPPQVPVVSLLSGGWTTKMSSDITQVFYNLAGAASSMGGLQHLGLHKLPLSLDLMPVLGLICSSLQHSLTTLTLDTYIVNNVKFGATEKALFFGAVARAKKLRELRMMQWEAVVGVDAKMCVSALKSLLYLDAIVVSKVKESDAFPSSLPFRTVEEESQKQ
jgi:hypothetical protein